MATENDVNNCLKAKNIKNHNQLNLQQKKISKLYDNKSLMYCNGCNNYFEVLYVLQTKPPQVQCSHCGKYLPYSNYNFKCTIS